MILDSHTKLGGEIPTGSPTMGATNAGALGVKVHHFRPGYISDRCTIYMVTGTVEQWQEMEIIVCSVSNDVIADNLE